MNIRDNFVWEEVREVRDVWFGYTCLLFLNKLLDQDPHLSEYTLARSTTWSVSRHILRILLPPPTGKQNAAPRTFSSAVRRTSMQHAIRRPRE